MSTSKSPRLLFVHAHPDDECLTTGGTIAHYAGRGAEVRVVTCTLGEEGEVVDDRFRLLSVDAADQLGGYRYWELSKSLEALGAGEPMLLGGVGRWRDSGMTGTPPRRHTRFIDAGPAAVDELAAVIDRLRPHVVVTYDPNGGYGHPDHRHAHAITAAAVEASAWKVPKLYWSVLSTRAMIAALDALTDVPDGWNMPDIAEFTFGFADEEIDAVIDAGGHLPAKVAALSAHGTQLTVAPDGRSCALSNNIALPIVAEEFYVLASGTHGPRDGRGWENDLLAGVNLG